MRIRILQTLIWIAVGALAVGCGRPEAIDPSTLERVEWHDLIRSLLDTDQVARLDTRTAFLESSTDPTGGNDDFNQPLRQGPPGWWVIADLEGPGYISRFWFTGAADGQHRVRFYFDNEAEPRIDLTIGEFCGGLDPFLPPLAVYENYCWYNLIPIPYQQRVIVMVEEGGYRPGNWPRLFHQINYHTLERHETIDTFPLEMTPADRDVIAEVRQVWADAAFHTPDPSWIEAEMATIIQPRQAAEIVHDEGGGIVRRLDITPDFSALPSAMARESLLRDWVLNIYWDGSDEPSVAVPLGDFFGTFWRRNRFQTLYVGSHDDTFRSHFPMPFRQSARVEIVNQGAFAAPVEIAWSIEPGAGQGPEWGFFHSAWQRTGPEDVGRPHVTLSTQGRGKFVGCFLAVVSADRSWWILEADEMIRVDRERTPGWRGTGLEDYFNGGWYYQNAIIRHLAGIPFKMPFRVLQYRLHLMDPVHFEGSVDVIFERGPLDESRGWMESVGYYYMEAPQAAASDLLTSAQRQPPDDGFGHLTAMTEINNFERIGDHQGAHDFIDWFLERYPNFEYAETLRLRQIAYVEFFEGIDVARPLYEAFLETATSADAISQAEDLLWFHQDEGNALLSFYANSPSAIFLNGRPIGSTRDAAQLSFFRVNVTPGRHALAMQSRFQPYPNWIQAYLRTHFGSVYTTPDWRWQFGARGAWANPGFNDSAWPIVGGTGVKGPPEVPHIWVVPHAHIHMQSVAVGLRPSRDWTDPNVLAAYRHEFELE